MTGMFIGTDMATNQRAVGTSRRRAVARNVRSFRRAAGQTQETLATSAGVARQTVINVEDRGTDDLEVLHKLADALGVGVNVLIEENVDAAEAQRVVATIRSWSAERQRLFFRELSDTGDVEKRPGHGKR